MPGTCRDVPGPATNSFRLLYNAVDFSDARTAGERDRGGRTPSIRSEGPLGHTDAGTNKSIAACEATRQFATGWSKNRTAQTSWIGDPDAADAERVSRSGTHGTMATGVLFTVSQFCHAGSAGTSRRSRVNSVRGTPRRKTKSLTGVVVGSCSVCADISREPGTLRLQETNGHERGKLMRVGFRRDIGVFAHHQSSGGPRGGSGNVGAAAVSHASSGAPWIRRRWLLLPRRSTLSQASPRSRPVEAHAPPLAAGWTLSARRRTTRVLGPQPEHGAD